MNKTPLILFIWFLNDTKPAYVKPLHTFVYEIIHVSAGDLPPPTISPLSLDRTVPLQMARLIDIYVLTTASQNSNGHFSRRQGPVPLQSASICT